MTPFANFYHDYYKNIRNSSAAIHTTHRCPLQCPYCMRQEDNIKKMIRESRDMPLEDMEKILKFSMPLTFTGSMSDPIYHENFLQIIKMCEPYSSKIKMNVQTNGTAKKLTWWKDVFASSKNILWTFALDGTDQETLIKYRVNSDYDEVLSVMRLAVSMGVRVEWQFIIFDHNEHQIEDAKRIADEEGFALSFIKSNRWDEELVDKYKVLPPSSQFVSKDKSTYEREVYKPMIFVKRK